MPRLFCSCLVCGKEAEVIPESAELSLRFTPRGWVSLLAVHWPRGMVDQGPMVLRICGMCFIGSIDRPH